MASLKAQWALLNDFALETHHGDNGTDSLCHRSCSLASITLLCRVGMIKLIAFVFQGFCILHGVRLRCAWSPPSAPKCSSPAPSPHALARRICPGEFLTGSPHLSAGKTYPPPPPWLHFHNNLEWKIV